jgi:hypothetical protein
MNPNPHQALILLVWQTIDVYETAVRAKEEFQAKSLPSKRKINIYWKSEQRLLKSSYRHFRILLRLKGWISVVKEFKCG